MAKRKNYSSTSIVLKGKAAVNARRFIALWRKCDASTWQQYLACGNKLSKDILGKEYSKNPNSMFH